MIEGRLICQVLVTQGADEIEPSAYLVIGEEFDEHRDKVAALLHAQGARWKPDLCAAGVDRHG